MDWTALFLFELIVMRMSGFVLMNPIFGRSNIPSYVKAGISLVLAVFVFSISTTAGVTVQVPENLLVFMLKLVLELGVGFVVGFVMWLFFMAAQMGGEAVDIQMGLSMAQTYDSNSNINMSVTSSILNILFVLTFFAANGHYTLIRLLVASADILPFGAVSISPDVSSAVVEVFIACMLLAIKLVFPILAAELLGVVGMGILMKAIPQINAFVINMEMKVVIGLTMLFFFLTPMTELLLDMERTMLNTVGQIIEILAM